jgi:iron complex outermembrane receptor protein
VLKYFPSLLVRKRHEGDYNHAILSTRASGTGNSARSLVFADGIQLSNLLGNGVSGLSVLPRKGLVTPEEIARVDVMYGPFSAAYSGNSVGAVVDCQTRMPNKFEAHVASNFSYQPFDRYNTHSNYKAWQTSASLGSRSGAWSWWLAVNHMDSNGQPLTFATRLLSAGIAGSSGTAVTGAAQDNNNAGQPWWILGTGTQYHTRQDYAKVKVAYDFSPTVRASYTFGLWQNDVDIAASLYRNERDQLRQIAASNTLPAAASGGAGTLTDGGGSGRRPHGRANCRRRRIWAVPRCAQRCSPRTPVTRSIRRRSSTPSRTRIFRALSTSGASRPKAWNWQPMRRTWASKASTCSAA